MKGKFTLFALLAAASPFATHAAAVYTETFNNVGFESGAPVLGPLSTTDSGSSDLWQYTNYYNIANFDGWAFVPGAYYAVQATSGGTDTSPFNGGVLLNESSRQGLSSTTSPLAAMSTSSRRSWGRPIRSVSPMAATTARDRLTKLTAMSTGRSCSRRPEPMVPPDRWPTPTARRSCSQPRVPRPSSASDRIPPRARWLRRS